MIFTYIFCKNENIKNIENNIGAVLIDQNFTCSQTIEVQKERLSRFLLIISFILGHYFILLIPYSLSLIELDLL